MGEFPLWLFGPRVQGLWAVSREGSLRPLGLPSECHLGAWPGGQGVGIRTEPGNQKCLFSAGNPVGNVR